MKKISFLLSFIFLVLVGYFLYAYTPLVNPNSINVKIKKPTKYLSTNVPISITISDKYPIKRIRISVRTMNVPIILLNKEISSKHTKRLTLNFKPNKIMPNGKGVLSVYIVDYSHNNFMHGFIKRIYKNVIISSTPPNVYLLSGIDNITAGGSALAIFYAKSKLPIKKAYVQVTYGNNKKAIFKTYNAESMFSNKHVYMTFFTYPYSNIHNWKTSAAVINAAGNETSIHIPVHYSVYKSLRSKLAVPKAFIKAKVINILKHENVKLKKNLLDDFLYTMKYIFPKNLKQIRHICEKSDNRLLWSKYPFTQLFHSVVETQFFVRRKWEYNGRVVFQTPFYHPGYDLASVDHAMVNASNAGRIIYEGYIGVFGKSLIIDHGFGLFTFYGHLNSYLLPVGSMVKRNQYVAISGSTGLAYGDHVDFSTLIYGYFVNPLDYWSKQWIEYNVINKIKQAKRRLQMASASSNLPF